MVKAVVVALAMIGATALSTPAQADTPGCVTRKEFYAAHKGMRMKRVHNLWDTRGRITARDVGAHERVYNMCSDGAEGIIGTYVRKQGVWRMHAKVANAE